MNIRDMIDTSTGLTSAISRTKHSFKQGDDVIIRKQANRHGPQTFSLKAAKVVNLIGGGNAIVSVLENNGIQNNKTVPLSQLEPATPDMKRKMFQFNNNQFV